MRVARALAAGLVYFSAQNGPQERGSGVGSMDADRTWDVITHWSLAWNSGCSPMPIQPSFRYPPPKLDRQGASVVSNK